MPAASFSFGAVICSAKGVSRASLVYPICLIIITISLHQSINKPLYVGIGHTFFETSESWWERLSRDVEEAATRAESGGEAGPIILLLFTDSWRPRGRGQESASLFFFPEDDLWLGHYLSSYRRESLINIIVVALLQHCASSVWFSRVS